MADLSFATRIPELVSQHEFVYFDGKSIMLSETKVAQRDISSDQG